MMMIYIQTRLGESNCHGEDGVETLELPVSQMSFSRPPAPRLIPEMRNRTPAA